MSLLRCPFCDHANPADADFCVDCGAKLDLLPCAKCGAVNKRDSVECYQCHAPIEPPRAAEAGADPGSAPSGEDAPGSKGATEEPASAAPAGDALPMPGRAAMSSIFERAAALAAAAPAPLFVATPPPKSSESAAEATAHAPEHEAKNEPIAPEPVAALKATSAPSEQAARASSPVASPVDPLPQPAGRGWIDKAAGLAAVVLVVVIAWFASRGTTPAPTPAAPSAPVATPATAAPPAATPERKAEPPAKGVPSASKAGAPSPSSAVTPPSPGTPRPSAVANPAVNGEASPPAPPATTGRRATAPRPAPVEAAPATAPAPTPAPAAAPAPPKPPRIEACTEAIAALGLCDPAAPKGRP